MCITFVSVVKNSIMTRCTHDKLYYSEEILVVVVLKFI